jgi:hypothetical protein
MCFQIPALKHTLSNFAIPEKLSLSGTTRIVRKRPKMKFTITEEDLKPQLSYVGRTRRPTKQTTSDKPLKQETRTKMTFLIPALCLMGMWSWKVDGCLRVPGFLEAPLWLDSGGAHMHGAPGSLRGGYFCFPLEPISRAVDKCPL